MEFLKKVLPPKQYYFPKLADIVDEKCINLSNKLPNYEKTMLKYYYCITLHSIILIFNCKDLEELMFFSKQ